MKQKELIKAFANPKTYEEKPAQSIKLIQTHISWVFLTGKYAYKIKKPVNLGFLDFTTLKKRKFYCGRELELNRRLCPKIYLKVLPVTQKNNKIKIKGSGKIIDYVLKMKQLPQEKLMDNLLKKRKVSKKTMEKMAKIMVNFHAKAETNEKITLFSSPKKLSTKWNQNFNQTKKFIGKIINKKDFDFTKNKVKQFMQLNKVLLLKRMGGGKIKQCHGDFHSGNVFIVNNKPYIFDCIEFSNEFACIDVAAEVAFMAMDLDYKDRKDLSDFFINRYLDYSKDYEIKKLLNFYKCYYAWVRGKVIAFRLKENIKKNDKTKIVNEAKKHFKLAIKYARNLK